MTVGIARTMERRCPDALLVNVSNPLTALCRAVTRETTVSTVGLCNELVGLTWTISLLFDVGMHEVDPVVGGVNHLPLVTALRIGGSDGFTMLRSLMDQPVAGSGRPDLDGASCRRSLAQGIDRGKMDEGRRCGQQPAEARTLPTVRRPPGIADTHVAEFFPWFVANPVVSVTTGACTTTASWSSERQGTDEAELAALVSAARASTVALGKLVAPLLDAIVSDHERHLPVNVPNTGQVVGLDHGPVLECMGVANDQASPRVIVSRWDPYSANTCDGSCTRRS